MISSRHSFYATGADCAVHPVNSWSALAQAAEAEIARIERHYSRYPADSEHPFRLR